MTQIKKPLGLLMNSIEAMGLEVTYAYDDLVFVEHNAFLFQMSEIDQQIYLFFNQDSDPAARKNIEKKVSQHTAENGLSIVYKGTYTLHQNEDDSFQIDFSNHSDS